MKYIKINNNKYELISANIVKAYISNELGQRNSLQVRLRSNINEIISSCNKVNSVVILDGDSEYDYSQYNIIGDITKHSDETVTVVLGYQLSQVEQLTADLNSSKAFLSQIAGQEVTSQASALKVRQSIEDMYISMDVPDNSRIINRHFCPIWDKNIGQVDVGTIYQTIVGVNTSNPLLEQVWKCRQSYNTSEYPDIYPDNEQTWRTFNIPLHGTSIESAMPWVRPTMAEDTYKKGEFMVYTDSKYYESLRDTDKSPDEYSADWKCHSN